MLATEDHGPIRVLRLARPPVNALNTDLLDALSTALDAAPRDGVRGIVLAGVPGVFSAGLDVPSLLLLDRAGLTVFWQAFLGCLARLAASPIPVVAAVTGQSPAGGAVLALYCDRRVMAEGDFRIGLNEVQVGLFPGPLIHRVFARVVGPRLAAECLSTGVLLPAARAHALGFVDDLAPVEQVVARSRAWLEDVLALPPVAYARTRAMVRADLVQIMTGIGPADYELMNEAWFSPETQATLGALVARLAKR